jgi:hypothetical protein
MILKSFQKWKNEDDTYHYVSNDDDNDENDNAWPYCHNWQVNLL